MRIVLMADTHLRKREPTVYHLYERPYPPCPLSYVRVVASRNPRKNAEEIVTFLKVFTMEPLGMYTKRGNVMRFNQSHADQCSNFLQMDRSQTTLLADRPANLDPWITAN
jgi:hypothetical protein